MPFPPSGQSPAWYGVTSSPQLKSPVSFSLGSMCRADLMQLSGLSRARIIDTHFTGQEKGGKCVNPGFPEFIAVPQHIIASSHVPVQTDSPGRGNSSDAWVLTCCRYTLSDMVCRWRTAGQHGVPYSRVSRSGSWNREAVFRDLCRYYRKINIVSC
jgi:hypothetical protein